MATGGLLGVDLKALLARTRPNLSPPIVTVSGYSFPSNHALNSMLFFTCLIVVVYPLVHRATRVALIAGSALVVLAIGLDRMALGVHYASDVLGGWLIALATVATTAAGFNPWRLQRTISASQDKSSRPGTP
jgi:undecaprenyl-diphosphatase